MANDKAIIEGVRAALARDQRLPHPAEVAVSEQEGTVTLRGSVRSLHQRLAAVEVAKSVPGVREVSDELSIDLLDRWEDDELHGAALQALTASDGVPDGRIQVSAAEGWVTLKGTVKQQSESDAAFEAVRRLPGVGGITNEIKVITAGVDG
jgi:osmotically-inducible protein OsmY